MYIHVLYMYGHESSDMSTKRLNFKMVQVITQLLHN